jgi:hypothetical protein
MLLLQRSSKEVRHYSAGRQSVVTGLAGDSDESRPSGRCKI